MQPPVLVYRLVEESNDAATPQPPPQPNMNPSVHDLVIADMQARKEFGMKKYGTILQASNGRDALMDLYQEILDAAMYCRQMIAERDARR